MQYEYIKSPVRYSGNKYKLLHQLFNYFPTDIDTFIDAFGGSGTVSLNITANKMICNDYVPYIMQLLNSWKTKDYDEYIKYLDSIDVHTEQEFKKLRTIYNDTKDLDTLYILILNSFNGQMRFNSNKEYNSTYAQGVRYFNNQIKQNLKDTINILKHKDITFTISDFRDINYDILTNSDFVYFDPPYSLSTAVYQDGKRGFKGWNKSDDYDLMQICDSLNDRNIKFAMSNLLFSKGKCNDELLEWSNNYNVIHFDFSYNKGVRKTLDCIDDEVLIMNYEVSNNLKHKQLNLF